MTKLSRLAWRLRRGALRWYEIALYALLAAMALAIALPATSSEAGDEFVSCGKAASSPSTIDK